MNAYRYHHGDGSSDHAANGKGAVLTLSAPPGTEARSAAPENRSCSPTFGGLPVPLEPYHWKANGQGVWHAVRRPRAEKVEETGGVSIWRCSRKSTPKSPTYTARQQLLPRGDGDHGRAPRGGRTPDSAGLRDLLERQRAIWGPFCQNLPARFPHMRHRTLTTKG